MHRLIFAALAGLALLGAPALACDATTPCEVATGHYYMRAPAGWDGKSALPTAVFFHGYGGNGAEVMQDEAMGRVLSDLGVLLVAPTGDNKGWSYPAKIQGPRDDFAFVASVLDDLERRVPVDHARLYATGFSIGGSMTWYLACLMGEKFAAFAPIAGAYWEPMPLTCPSGPVSLRHIHGLADKTVPMGGRSLRNGQFRQGDVMRSIAQLKTRDACQVSPARTEQRDGMTCQIWPAGSCGSGREIELCLHAGEHEIDPQWVGEDYRWVDRLAKAKGL